MTLRDNGVALGAKLGRLRTTFGVARTTVTIRVRTYSGPKSVDAAFTDADLVIDPRPVVEQLSAREVAGSGGTYEEGDWRVSEIPPAFTGGGYTPAELKPTAGDGQDVLYVLTGDDGTRECTLVRGEFDDPISYSLVVRERNRS